MNTRTPAQQRVADLWRDLTKAGAFRHGIFARLDTWLWENGWPVADPIFLTDAQAGEAARRLSNWLDRVLTEKARSLQPSNP